MNGCDDLATHVHLGLNFAQTEDAALITLLAANPSEEHLSTHIWTQDILVTDETQYVRVIGNPKCHGRSSPVTVARERDHQLGIACNEYIPSGPRERPGVHAPAGHPCDDLRYKLV